MKRKKKQDKIAIELTGLIDIVFLLLIFFLVSFAFSLAGDVSDSKSYADLELPKTRTELSAIEEDILENLMIQIVPDTNNYYVSKTAYILWPSYNDSVKITRVQALNRAITDSTFAAFPPDILELSYQEFQNLPPCTLITNSIKRYIDLEKFNRGNTRPLIEMRAERNTEFQILSFIMDQCSSYNDIIPQIVIRTVQ